MLKSDTGFEACLNLIVSLIIIPSPPSSQKQLFFKKKDTSRTQVSGLFLNLDPARKVSDGSYLLGKLPPEISDNISPDFEVHWSIQHP